MRYTDRVEQVFRVAKEKARELCHAEVQAIHVLFGLAITDVAGSLVANVLKNHHLPCHKIHDRILAQAPGFFTSSKLPPDLPWSEFAQFVSGRGAVQEAEALGHGCVGTEHVFLAMTRLSAQQWFDLTSAVELANMRAEMLALLGHPQQPKKPPAHEVILGRIEAYQCSQYAGKSEGVIHEAFVFLLLEILLSMDVPKKDLPAIIGRLEKVRPTFCQDLLRTVISALKIELTEA